MNEELAARVRSWMAVDPDPETVAELALLLDAGAESELAARFDGRLQFGTAGLRGALGAGPQRMNRVVVRRAAHGLVEHLLATDPRSATRGVVIGYDARRNSDVFALDTARVVAARGLRALLVHAPVPTPVLASAILDLDAAAGVMVTASHNPPADNGYKVYLGDGAQIVPPHDRLISGYIDDAPLDVPVAAADDPLISVLRDGPVDAYLDSIRPVAHRDVRVAYTPLHGVGGAVLLAAFERAGLPVPAVVTQQFEPDGTFPTVSFPNPEEPGAMDMLLDLAERVGADVALANDPDADRLGVAVPGRDGWRVLRGDEIGWLLADHVLRSTVGDDRLVVTTLVSSSLLADLAAAHGVHHAEVFTGFKWIARAALDRPDLRLVFGYEQALGYLVGDRPLDKDGITAAVAMAALVGELKALGVTVEDRLDELAARFGRHVVADRSLRMEPDAARRAVERLRDAPPDELAGERVGEVTWIEEAGLLRLLCGSARVQVRPSGTEPKVKLYAEAVDADPGPLLDSLVAALVAASNGVGDS